jgi:excisionase family DNA binding protein
MDHTAPKPDFSCPALTIAEAAELLRMAENTLYELVKKKEVPGAYRLGRSWKIHGPTVLTYMVSGQSPFATAGAR